MCMLITRCTRGNKEAFLLPLDILDKRKAILIYHSFCRFLTHTRIWPTFLALHRNCNGGILLLAGAVHLQWVPALHGCTKHLASQHVRLTVSEILPMRPEEPPPYTSPIPRLPSSSPRACAACMMDPPTNNL